MRRTLIMSLAAVAAFCTTIALACVFVPGAQNTAPFTKGKSTHQKQYKKQWPSAEMKAQMKAERERQLNAYYGTAIAPAPNVTGSELDLHNKIAAAFSRLDPKVPERKKTFGWCFADPTLRVTGWRGFIRRVSESPEAHLVEVQIGPSLASTRYGGSLHTSDYCIERWRYANDKLTYVKAVKASVSPGSLMGD